MKAVKPRKWMLLALLLAALGGRAETVRLRTGLESDPGTWAPCNATLSSGDYASEVMIVNGSYTPTDNAITMITFTPPPGDVSPFFLSAGAASGYEFVEWRVTTLDPSLVMFFDGASLVQATTWPVADATLALGVSCSITAIFRPLQNRLVVSHDGNALAVSPPVGTNLYAAGTVVSLSSTPVNSSYAFLQWEDPAVPGVPHPDVLIDTSYTPPRYRIVMDRDFSVKAVFAQVFYVTAGNPGGPMTAPIVTSHAAGSLPTIAVQTDTIPYGISERDRCVGWTGGGPQIPATGYGPSYTFSSGINADNTINWSWLREYRVVTFTEGIGSGSIIGAVNDSWHTNGTLLNLTALTGPNSIFAGWTRLSGVQVLAGAGTASIQVRLIGPAEIAAAFSLSTEPPAFRDWKERFGLGLGTIPGVSGMEDDPDKDGLTNWQEFNIVFTNRTISLFCNPLNADTDGDGMIDGWEHEMFVREYNENEKIVPAPLDGGTIAAANRYGQYGNPDGDHLWSTADGWELTLPLYNWLEYCGPDGVEPWTIEEIPSASLGLPAGKTVRRAVVNPLDSSPRDTSHPLEADSDSDLYDDGFEYSWDQWHQLNGAALLAPTTTTNLWPGITETVDDMAGAWHKDGNRPFQPAVPHELWSPLDVGTYGNHGNIDLDFWFNQELGVIEPLRPLTDLDEYLASGMSSATNTVDGTVPIAYGVLRPRRAGTTTRWCTNPFVWDTDGDGMPDGWELTFGFDPWAVRSLNAGTPADRIDATHNPDRDGFAFDGTLRHYAVYLTYGFNPLTGYRHLKTPFFRKNSAEYNNFQELVGVSNQTMADMPLLTLLSQSEWRSTHPFKVDSDDDGVYDGWEGYVDMNPLEAIDAGLDFDDPPTWPYPLTNFEEFDSAATSPGMTNADYRVAGWFNKRFPTDPRTQDTDGDQMWDGAEKVQFNNGGAQELDGGLCPTTVDTDGDFLPDGWEAYYGMPRWTSVGGTNAPSGTVTSTAPVNGTIADAFEDPDGDGLLNYQEYMTGTVYHWQFQHVDAYGIGPITVFEPDVKPLDLYAYDPYDFLDPLVYGRQPYEWDERFWVVKDVIPLTYLAGVNYFYARQFPIPQYSTTDPGLRDSDLDMMDDHYEIYHGLNPVYGFNDLVRRKYYINGTVDAVVGINNFLNEYDALAVPQPPDLRRYPWMAGDPLLDPDQDQILSIDEAILIDGPVPPATHTDPSPLWMTDISSPHSWVNQFYWLGNTMGGGYWFWAPLFIPPSYMFSFEMNEGFDTDNDGIADRAEIVHNSTISPGVTSPIESQSPRRRRALYLDGYASAARTTVGYAHLLEDLRRFTVEVWARPANPARGVPQTIVERSGIVPQGNPDLPAGALLVNFQIGLDEAGVPFVRYHGNTMPYLFTEAKATSNFALQTNEWAHLAATFDGPEALEPGQTWAGLLKLYVNGEIAASVPSAEIPVNGAIGGIGLDPNSTNSTLQTTTILPMSINVGASDYNSGAMIHGDVILVGPASGMMPGFPPPSFYNHFQGHVDEIRVWNRGHPQEQIVARMKQTFTREEVVQLEDQQMLRYYYTFDDLPDPNNLVAPVGFASVMGRPIGYYASPWWGNAAPGVRSEWYDDYRWMPFIENLVAHRPLTLPLDATLPAVETDTNGVTRARYPNDSNPYTLWYRTGTQFVLEDHPFLGNDGEREWGAEGMWGELPIAPDLLPCGLARTDESVPLWDNDTPGSADYDSDDDGMPDDWELANGLDPNDPADAALDPDGDGLSNLVEWKIGSDPNNTHSLNPLVSDRNWDSDGDGLSNYDEAALHGTDPANPDTDDDGVSDGEEVSNLSNPVYARSPVHARSLDIQGTHYLIPEGTDSDTGRFDLEAWTVEFWVYPRQAGMDATLVERRHADIAGNIQFGMALEDGVPLVRFTTAGGHVYQAKAADALPVNAWKHLAGVWDPERDTLELYVDGIRVMAQACVEQPARGLGTTRLGDTGGALFAYVDDVRIWGIARMAEEIAMNHDTFAGFMTVGDQAANYEGILFPNGAVAFADEVVHFVVGDGDGFVPNAHTDASQALGAPDDGFVSLGISDITSVTNAGGIGYHSSKGYLVVQFKDNVVQRSWDARPDLVIFEGADRKDSFYVWVSIDGDQFYFAGFAEGGTSLIDLDYYLSRLENHEDIDGIQYVQIVDSGMNTWSTLGMPGADIKAVAALNHSVMPLAWYPFDDGQNESLVNPLSGLVEQYGAQDFVHLRDWENDWRHAIRLSDLNTNALVFNDTIVPAYSTFDSDADGLPDEFEAAFDLDPFNADENGNGVLDGWDDFDLDGLSNYAEWLAGTHPWNPDTDGDGISDYEDISVGSARMNGVRFTDNDHVEDHWEARAVDGYASPYRYDEHLDLDGDGWINWSEARTGTRPDTEYNEPVAGAVGTASYPQPPLLVTLDYPGVRDRSSATPMLVVHAYTDAYMNGKPDAVYALPLPSPGSWPKNLSLTTNELHAGHLRQGRNYFQAFIDLDGSVGAIAGPTWTLGEPAAIADGHDKGIDIGWDRNEVRFGLTDAARNFARFSWEDSPYASPDVNRVSILNGSGTEIFVRYFSAPRTWLHEGDLIAGKEQNFGLGWGQVFPPRHIFTWRLNGAIESSQTFTNDYLASLPVPATVAPKNDVLAGARTTYLFRLHPEATEFEFELRRGTIGGTVVYSGRHLAPSRGIYDTLDGSTLTDVCSWRFPYHAGDVLPSGQIFSNDTYYWRVRGFSPTTAAGTAWSDQPSFRLDVNAGATDGAGKGWLTVNVRYPGAAGLGGGAPIRVQAFATRAFNGIPDAEKQISAVGSVTLAGLDPGVYYIRAYVDQNNNRRRDFWESYGYYRSETDPVEPFRVKDVQVVALGMSQPLTVTIRDADTDNDKIPDAIEYLMHGAGGGDWLAVAGPGPIASSDPYTDFDGDGLNDLSELDAGTRWDLADSDGDGIPDRLDRDLFGVDQVGEIQMLQLTGLDPAAGTLGWRWTTEAALGSGLQPLAAPDTPMRSLGTSAAYIVEFTTSLTERVWQPVTNLSSDAAGGQLSLPRTVSPSGFYRIRMLAE